ncbi:MAG: alpha/beta hydrolase [Nitrospiraceae bacterium]
MMSLRLMNVLLITDSTEQTTRLTHALRRHHEACRIESVRTLEEGIEWAGRLTWDVILLDADHDAFSGPSCIRSLRAQAPQTGILLHSERTVLSPLQAMQHGADAVLFRQSANFTDEVLSASQEVLIRKERPATWGPTLSQYLHLVESTGLVLYELNTRGEFTYVSPGFHRWLGYGDQEPLGCHYSRFLDPDSRRYAEQRFNERRAGARATRRLDLHLLPKFRKGILRTRLHAVISAKGLYAPHHTFLGTLGVIHARVLTHPGQSTIELPVAPEPTGQPPQPTPPWEYVETLWQQIHHFLGKPREAELGGEDRPFRTPVSQPRQAETMKPEPVSTSTAASSCLSPPVLDTDPVPTRHEVQQPDRSLIAPRQTELPTHQLHTEIRSDHETVSGVTTALDVTGLHFHLATRSTNVPTGKASIRLASDVMFLHLTGIVMVDAARPSAGRVLFDSIEVIQRAVLLSFLEALREDPDGLKVEIVITGGTRPTSPSERSPRTPWTIDRGDRRLNVRLPCAYAALLATPKEKHRNGPIALKLQDISLGGCRFSSPMPLPISQGPFQLILAPFGTPPACPIGTSGSARDTVYGLEGPDTLPIMIIWERHPDTETPSLDQQPHWTYGARLAPIPDPASGSFFRLVNHQALFVMEDPERRIARRVVTDLLFCMNPYDRKIVLYHDHEPGSRATLAPLVIIVPGFAHPKEGYAELAYDLASQGMQVLRYDCTNHIGESDALAPHAMLSDMLLDFATVLDLADEFWPSCPLFVIGHGIGGRIAARGLKDHSRLAGLLLLHAPLDLDQELHRLQQTDNDPMQMHRQNFDSGNIYGINVISEPFIRDAILSRLAGSQDFLDDLDRLRASVGIFAPLEEAAAHRDLLDRMRATLGEACRFVAYLAEPITGIPVRPLHPDNWFDRIVRFCLAEASYAPRADGPVLTPTQDLHLETSLERTRVRSLHARSSTERARNWTNYAIHSRTLLNLPDYWKLLERSCQLLGPLEATSRLLCIGDVSGHLGTFLLTHHAFRHRTLGPTWPVSPAYTGLDFCIDGLIQSRRILLSILGNISHEAPRPWPTDRYRQPSFCLGDLDSPLPLADNSFDAVFCHIVLGHFADPLSAIRECLRVLLPGGRLVVWCLQPDADLRTWHQHQLSGSAPDAGPPSRELLHAYGEIQRSYLEGVLWRFTHRQVELLLETAGGCLPSVESALSHLLHVASAKKPNSTG